MVALRSLTMVQKIADQMDGVTLEISVFEIHRGGGETARILILRNSLLSFSVTMFVVDPFSWRIKLLGGLHTACLGLLLSSGMALSRGLTVR